MELKLINNYYKPSYRIPLHILFWVGTVVFFGVLWGSYVDEYVKEFTILLIELPVKIAIVYINLYILIPRYLQNKRYEEYLLWLIPSMILAGAFQRVVAYYFIYPQYFPEAMTGVINFYKIIKYAVSLNTIILFTTTVKIIKYWYQDQRAAQRLAQEKLEAELKFLKGQIHPHFLFNTLNNLYSLTLKKSDCAPEVVLKLSELMDYMLFGTTAPLVPLEKEIKYIKNYIALEKIRYGDRVDISLNISGEISGNHIAPLLLLPFLENSFKHGVSGEIERAWVTIDLNIKQGQLVYKVENSKCCEEVQHTGRTYAQGIGLKNLKRRLALIYKDRHDLRIWDEESTYLAILKIQLEFSADASKLTQEKPTPLEA